jgi:hypothetical protein
MSAVPHPLLQSGKRIEIVGIDLALGRLSEAAKGANT